MKLNKKLCKSTILISKFLEMNKTRRLTHPKSRWLTSEPLQLLSISLARLFFEYPPNLDRLGVICENSILSFLSTAGSQASEKKRTALFSDLWNPSDRYVSVHYETEFHNSVIVRSVIGTSGNSLIYS